MIFQAYAKINLLLRVLRKRADGYHDLLTVMRNVSLSDRIELRPSEEEGIALECDDPALPADERNLAYQAASHFYHRLGWEPFLRIRLEKRIPAQAGLGGGSADAATVLNGLNAMHGFPLEEIELFAIAGILGSDVPFFVQGGTAVAEGRGERLRPIRLDRPIFAVLATPSFGIETPWAFRRTTPSGDAPSELIALLEENPISLEKLIPWMTNDLEPAVREAHPEIRRIEDRLRVLGAYHALMTGSGSSTFGLFETAELADRAAKAWNEDADAPAVRLCVVSGVDRGCEEE